MKTSGSRFAALSPPRLHARPGPTGAGWRAGAWCPHLLGALLAAGCAAPPSTQEPPEVQAPAAAAMPVPGTPVPAAPRACARCAGLDAEVATLRRRLAERESELGELRAKRDEQARALREADRQAAAATARLRRLATRAAAASYLAEVEVSLASAPGQPLLLARARELLAASREPFVRGDYDTAIDRASQAAEVVGRADDDRSFGRAPATRAADGPLQRPLAMRTRVDSHLRARPGRNGRVLAVVPAGAPVTADARRRGWLHVATGGGRGGWIYSALLEPR
jgi:hypothetical protein